MSIVPKAPANTMKSGGSTKELQKNEEKLKKLKRKKLIMTMMRRAKVKLKRKRNLRRMRTRIQQSQAYHKKTSRSMRLRN